MNKLFEIKKSKVSGKGVFSLKKIKKNQRICFLTGELCDLDEILRRLEAEEEEPSDPLGVGDEKYLDLDEEARTFNHSCNPNAFIHNKNELVALKDIKIGAEITFDYSTTMNDNEEKLNKAGRILWDCRCHCGAKNCRKTIKQFKTLPKKVQNFYVKNKFMPAFMIKHFK